MKHESSTKQMEVNSDEISFLGWNRNTNPTKNCERSLRYSWSLLCMIKGQDQECHLSANDGL
jgi:hypothetical protein